SHHHHRLSDRDRIRIRLQWKDRNRFRNFRNVEAADCEVIAICSAFELQWDRLWYVWKISNQFSESRLRFEADGDALRPVVRDPWLSDVTIREHVTLPDVKSAADELILRNRGVAFRC